MMGRLWMGFLESSPPVHSSSRKLSKMAPLTTPKRSYLSLKITSETTLDFLLIPLSLPQVNSHPLLFFADSILFDKQFFSFRSCVCEFCNKWWTSFPWWDWKRSRKRNWEGKNRETFHLYRWSGAKNPEDQEVSFGNQVISVCVIFWSTDFKSMKPCANAGKLGSKIWNKKKKQTERINRKKERRKSEITKSFLS